MNVNVNVTGRTIHTDAVILPAVVKVVARAAVNILRGT